MRRINLFLFALTAGALLATGLSGCGGKASEIEVTVAKRPGLNVGYLSMNNRMAPFDDVRVRQAVAFAVDKERLVKLAYRGLARPAPVPVPPTIMGHHDGIVDRTPNIEKAKALLAEAGITGDKLNITLSHGNNSRPYMPRPEDVAKQIAGDLESIGFNVEIRVEEWSAYLTMVQNGQHQLALLGWSADVPDPDNFLYVLLDKSNARVGSANNISFYENEEVSDLLTQARGMDGAAERERLYRKAQEIIFDEAPMVPLVYTERAIAHGAAFGTIEVEPVTHPVLRRVMTPKDGELVYLRGSDSVHLDPGDVTDGESSKVVEQIFDQLVRFKPGAPRSSPLSQPRGRRLTIARHGRSPSATG